MMKGNVKEIAVDAKFVDLHLHSYHSRRNKDVIQWFDELSTLICLRDHKIKVFAITDHDTFSASLYSKLKQLNISHRFNMAIFPGVEITVKRVNEDRGHILFIFDNNITDEQAKKIQDVVFRNAHSYGTNIDSFVSNVDKLGIDYMMIPHVGKCDYVVYQDVKDYMDRIPYVESPDNKSELNRFNANLEKPVANLMFSDTHMWDTYNGSNVYIDNDQEINISSLKTQLKYKRG